MNGTFHNGYLAGIRLTALVFALMSGFLHLQAQDIPSCACKGSINVSVDEDCQAPISSQAILASGSTCGAQSSSLKVTLMKTPTGDIIAEGIGSALLTDGHVYIGKTIYGKVSDPSGQNSCWTTIYVEDKIPPLIICPPDLTLTCYQIPSYLPVVIENCSHFTMNVIAETVTVNDCQTPGLTNDVLKVIRRTYQAEDESGNKSAPCTMTITVTGLPSLMEPYITMPANKWIQNNTALKCNENYPKIPAGQPFAGNPLPQDLVMGNIVRKGTGVPQLLLWDASSNYKGTVSGNAPSKVKLTGGYDNTQGNNVVVGSQICFTSLENQSITFDFNTFVANDAGTNGGQFVNNAPVYSVNGTETNLPASLSANAASGTRTVSLQKSDRFCFRVYTENKPFYTTLEVSNMRSNVPAATPHFYLPAYPTPDLYCNIMVSFTDVTLPPIGCVTKVMRTWSILEWSCRTTQRTREYLQMIEIVDDEGPSITCPPDFSVSTNGHDCHATLNFPPAVVSDNCSQDITVDVAYEGGFIDNTNGGIGHVPVGCQIVRYIAYDGCYNSSSCRMRVTVEDNTSPVAICDQNTTIALTLGGEAWVPASVFDDGSYDDCGLAKMLVRRMDAPACTPCKTPVFPGFTYLGDFVNPGKPAPHYYYISKHKATPDVAFKSAAAMGGNVVAINTLAENSWVYGKVKEWNLGLDYLIGYQDVKRKGQYAWQSGETTGFTHWAPGNPKSYTGNENPFGFVRALDATSRWESFGVADCDASEWLYVVEITDPCGFSESAPFCCTDVASSPRMVQFRVIDKSGNWNDCMVNAFIQDKLPPSITCPQHTTVFCDDYFDTKNLRSTFGWAVGYDNCDNLRITTDSIINLTSCNTGSIVRNFTATDPGGRTATCQQTITVSGKEFSHNIVYPVDVNIEACDDPSDPRFSPDVLGRPNLQTDNICSLLGSRFEDEVYRFNNSSGDACFKILRKWTVIDWCRFAPNRRPDGSLYPTSYVLGVNTWQHTQVIKVGDKQRPVITSSCASKEVCTFDPTCKDGYIELLATATDNCTDVLRWTYKIDAFNNGSFDSGLTNSGLGNTIDASGEYPIGTHKIVWSFEDRCGNITSCDQLFTIVNCKAPTPYCLNGLSTSLMPMDTNNDGTADAGMVEIWAKDFDNGSSHPCGYQVYISFNPITLDAAGKPVLAPSRIFTCSNLGRNNVNVYVGVITSMGQVVQDYCSTFITVQDNSGVCGGSGGRLINGALMTENLVPVQNVDVNLIGGEMNTATGLDGSYTFANVINGGSYVIKPRKNDDHLNGVSTLDLVMIQRHILGIEKLNTTGKLIAADVNHDQKIAASDIIELRKLILGITNSFSNNESWRFYDKSYTFQDPVQAHAESMPENYVIQSMEADMTVDFVSVKIGDVNHSVKANANSLPVEARNSSVFALTTENQMFTSGQTLHMPVKLKNTASVNGFQFTVKFNPELVSLESIQGNLPGMTDNNFGFAKISSGLLAVSYHRESSADVSEDASLFTLTFKARDNSSLSEAIEICSAIASAEAYDADLNTMKVTFEVDGRAVSTALLYQNTPNPFKSITSISFELPESREATLSLYDASGRLVRNISGRYSKGLNTIECNSHELGGTGVYYYTLESGDFKATKKMVIIE